MDQVQTWVEQLIANEKLWMVQVFLLVFVTLLLAAFVRRLLKVVVKHAHKSKNRWDDTIVEAAMAPLRWLIWLVGLSWAAEIAHDVTEESVLQYADSILRVGVIVLLSWFLVRLVKYGEKNFLIPESGKTADPTTVMAVGKLLRIAIVITSGLVLLQSMGYSISGVLAFGGVGGIAVGFAAKDLLANFFGGLMIYLDRPFKVGDWVRSPDQEIEGTVEEIGLRLTRIRTFDKRPLYVPNQTFTQISVENPSRMFNRRIYETIGVRYEDAEKVPAIVEKVRAMLEQHEEIDNNQTLIVNFNAFADSSLNFFVYTFTKTVNWVRYHEVKQDVLLKILKIVAEHEAECAFPTRTLHLPDGVSVNSGNGE
ncbi:mechanosensitive ion channel family protein [Gilvimarinus agarilyticus]|uniref:mechanosensitive ion channel family protein n=1 Tax=unclassified Gilvimarinus TaxID=2642066 RepID=UPI001C090E0A|nr:MULTISPECIES: mechanosensitive ion channel family protein [unclassified Gilvimarinus]MBU2885133.1 mechanosensitive ion channel family protein [Gilvimarinus agarilyticus]MDO6570031.1 mechanosensitive ion channel family protein [Gilvimarinus sp. 2_MG-2023]MDO6747298.1 mechanosensitive ion channel family protein [Gilvimarinus sp. 1_MG-2023]